jgi:predicted Zn-dependent protease with MMP-like domain
MINKEESFASQLTFDEFDQIFAEELSKIPEQFKEGVSQFILEESLCRYNKYLPGLYTLGLYKPRGELGQPVVVIYFGSFKNAFANLKVVELQKEIAKTIAHELLHHWELQSGYDDLGEEDKKQLAEWKNRKNYRTDGVSVGKNLLETALYIYFLFVLVAVIARWIGTGF